jgi:hypothetical protein
MGWMGSHSQQPSAQSARHMRPVRGGRPISKRWCGRRITTSGAACCTSTIPASRAQSAARLPSPRGRPPPRAPPTHCAPPSEPPAHHQIPPPSRTRRRAAAAPLRAARSHEPPGDDPARPRPNGARAAAAPLCGRQARLRPGGQGGGWQPGSGRRLLRGPAPDAGAEDCQGACGCADPIDARITSPHQLRRRAGPPRARGAG